MKLRYLLAGSLAAMLLAGCAKKENAKEFYGFRIKAPKYELEHNMEYGICMEELICKTPAKNFFKNLYRRLTGQSSLLNDEKIIVDMECDGDADWIYDAKKISKKDEGDCITENGFYIQREDLSKVRICSPEEVEEANSQLKWFKETKRFGYKEMLKELEESRKP